MSEDTKKPRIVMEVCRDGWTRGLQLGIAALDENGHGDGYRIAGPKYNGSQEALLSTDLDERDAREIREYLDRTFPVGDLAGELAKARRSKTALAAKVVELSQRLSNREREHHADREELGRLRDELAARPSRAEVLREAADAAERVGQQTYLSAPEELRAEGAWATAAELRRMADGSDGA